MVSLGWSSASMITDAPSNPRTCSPHAPHGVAANFNPQLAAERRSPRAPPFEEWVRDVLAGLGSIPVKSDRYGSGGDLRLVFEDGQELHVPDGPFENWHYENSSGVRLHGGVGRVSQPEAAVDQALSAVSLLLLPSPQFRGGRSWSLVLGQPALRASRGPAHLAEVVGDPRDVMDAAGAVLEELVAVIVWRPRGLSRQGPAELGSVSQAARSTRKVTS